MCTGQLKNHIFECITKKSLKRTLVQVPMY